MIGGSDTLGRRSSWSSMTAYNPIKLFFSVTLLTAGLFAGANAQQYIGGTGQSSVFVDYSVIDNLGRSPNIPQLLLGAPGTATIPGGGYVAPAPKFPVISSGRSSAKVGGIVLRPPKAVRKRATKRKKSARKSLRKFTQTTRRVPAAKRTQRQIRPLAPPKDLTLPRAVAAPPPPKISAPTRTPVPTASVAPEPPKPTPVVRKPLKSVTLPAPTPLKVVPQNAVPAAPKIAKPKIKPAAQVASLPPIGQPLKAGATTRIGFSAGSAKLNGDASARLQDVSTSLKKNSALRIQLLAYASAKDGSASQARRLSLSRALAARSYLIEKGVRSTRIDVRALGNRSGSGPTDRIDIIVTTR
ncbi:MAG: OmpA family protein [Alphaproteobacteria bacterium]|nr:OmpA family protein [Alphaproteobacteria bacterium]